MTERTRRLREASLAAEPSISSERAMLLTDFYREHEGRHPTPVLRALCFAHLCEHQSIWLGDEELIVGERGPKPKAVPTFPELTCHTLEDLRILDSREKTPYRVPDSCFEDYEEVVIPFWNHRSLRDRLFSALPASWHRLYEAGLFTEFMEQRAPGHAVLDGKIYRRGMRQLKGEIAVELARLDGSDPEFESKRDALRAMEIACDAMIRFAERHAELAEERAAVETNAERRAELERIAAVCRRVPAEPPRDLQEAIQAYWFCHLGVVTELNGWDAFSPGHLDQHLAPFYRSGISDGSLTRESARELVEALFVKFNNHPAPPKVGVTAAESGTYTDFANISLGGVLPDGTDGSSEMTWLLLDVIEEMHLLQPSTNLQLASVTPDAVLARALQVIRRGYGFPSLFNADMVVAEQLRVGKSIEDARAGGCSGCVETSAFGKESCVLTGYFNLPKVLELVLHDGVDPRTGERLLTAGGVDPGAGEDFESLCGAFELGLAEVLEVKLAGNAIIERMYAESMPAPFLSLLVDDCVRNARDYNAGGARYHNRYVQMVGIGTITDSLSAIRQLVHEEGRIGLVDLVRSLDRDFEGAESLRQRLVNRVPRWGNDDDRADDLMARVFESAVRLVDGRPSETDGRYRVQMLPTTCHVYFGSVTGATPDGRRAGRPLSEGISAVQGTDRLGPTAMLRSAAKMDHRMTGGTLLNMKLTPALLEGDEGIEDISQLVRGYFRLGGHHIQFNVVEAETLRAARAEPEQWRDLIVRVAGYSDYFCDLSPALQEEIIERTEHRAV
ncbi:MAG: glycyl radical protein [marine benthic group bacterium]|nr:glycyl radical protein [Gemmatimonadota bacterium]